MKIYLDVIFIINLWYDFLILSSVSILLKRNASIKQIILGCLIGSSTMITLFISLDKTVLLLFKIITSISMVVITFGGKNIIENIFYFYIVTIILGGSQYLITGNEYEVNIILMFIISPIILYLYIRSIKEYRANLNMIYDVIIIDKDNIIKLNGYMDTGNRVKETITNLPVIMVNNKYNLTSDKCYYVPINMVNTHILLKCIKVDKVIINSKIVNVLIGLVNDNVFDSKYDVVLNEYIREMIEC